MWYEINNSCELTSFMDTICHFHDSCIKEMKYLSGAYVDSELSMYPLDDRKILNVIVQRQFPDIPMLEMEFSGLKYMQLMPCSDNYTCEIMDSTMMWKDGRIYWCDCGGLSETDLEQYDGTLICALKLRWRPIDNCMGSNEFFNPIV